MAASKPAPASSGKSQAWFVRGDIDGFFGLALDNLVQLLVIDALCRGVLGFSDELLYGTVLPGAAVSLVVGNLYYAWQSKKLADAEGRDDDWPSSSSSSSSNCSSSCSSSNTRRSSSGGCMRISRSSKTSSGTLLQGTQRRPS